MPNDLSARLTEIVKQTVAAVEAAVRATVEEDVVRLIRGGSSSARVAAAVPAAARAIPRRGSSRRGVAEADLQRVLQAVRDNPGVRAEAVAPLAGLERTLVKKALAKLRASGAVRTSGEKRATTYRAAGRGAAPATVEAKPAPKASPKAASGRRGARRAKAKPAAATKAGGARKTPARKGPPPGTKVKRITDAELRKVLDVLAKKPGLTSVQIQAEAGIDAKEAGRVLLKLRKTKRVKWQGERAAATYAVA